MTIRHSLLAAGAILVLGMAIYLVREVSRAPAAPPPHATRPSPTVTETTPTPEPTAARTPEPRTRRSAEPTPAAPTNVNAPPPATPERVAPTGPNPKLDAVMAEANRAYDMGDFDEAKQIAQKVLASTPDNVRMLRIVISSECIAGDASEAQKYFAQLPPPDRAQMRTRCERYGVALKDP